jgi:uncharacterized protein YehS (DUF1456 family)
MNNNDILRRLRYAFDFSNKHTTELFSLDPNSSAELSQSQLLQRLAKEEDAEFTECTDSELAAFLDGLIVSKRGLREPPKGTALASVASNIPVTFRLSKNDILKKLRIAMNYREKEMMAALKAGGSTLTKSELGALFRNSQHKHFRACGNQVLRNFIKGLTLSLRD